MKTFRTMEWIQQHLGVEAVFGSPPQGAVRYLGIDTRALPQAKETLFFALVGQRDGHSFLEKAYRLGVRNFVVSKRIDASDWPDATFYLVKDTLFALQAVATAHRSAFQLPVLAITGSNGKTIIKEWLFQLLHKNFSIVRSPGSYNSQIGVPLSVWQIEPQHDLALFEAGISQSGEMKKLAALIQPTMGIFTNIGTAHEAGFEDQSEKVAEKMQLFEQCSTLIYAKDYDLIHEAAQRLVAADARKSCLFWTRERDPFADLSEVQSKTDKKGLTTIVAKSKKGTLCSIRIPFSDKASFENALHCWVFLRHLGLSQKTIARRMRQLQAVEMRLEIKTGIQRCTLLNDSYNNDLTSLGITLAQAAKQANGQRLTLVLSDILQNQSPDLYNQVAQLLLEFGFNRVFGIGKQITALKKVLPKAIESQFFPNTDVFLEKIHTLHFSDELIVLKGARPYAFERIVRRLEHKAHKTILEVSLGALVHNLNVYRRCLQPKTKILAMVKAAGYGSGSEQVARLLAYQGVDYLGVAYADEGVELRQVGINLPIMVLNTEASSFETLARYKLEPEVYSLHHLSNILDFCEKSKQKLRIHLKLETGMNRLGFEESELPTLLRLLKTHTKQIEVASIFSHLAGSDSALFDDFTQIQAEKFERMSNVLLKQLPPTVLRHLVNTGGIVRHPTLHYDMVRLGIGLYGIEVGGGPEALRVVSSLKATISQIHSVEKGATIGYNRAGKVPTTMRIATVSIGYADGLLRLAGNGRYAFLINGKAAPTIGNICMDMCMVDISAIRSAKEGDEVEVFGAQLPVQKLADALQTIPYEVFTNISSRVKRVYIED